MTLAGYQPPLLQRPNDIVISPLSWQSLGTQLLKMGQVSVAQFAVPAANVVMYVPFTVNEPVTITKLAWGIGAAAGNLDAGIYDSAGVLLVSTGSTAAAGSSALQVVDVTDTRIGRGQFYLALVADTITTLTVSRVPPAAGICQSLGLLEQASVTLPLATNASPATFAKYTRAYIPIVMAQGYRTVGP